MEWDRMTIHGRNYPSYATLQYDEYSPDYVMAIVSAMWWT